MRVLSRVVVVALFGLIAIAAVLVGPLDGASVERAPLPPGAAGEAAARVMPSVVDIRAQGGGVERGRIAIGTGVIVDQSGLIVTNDHVVTGESDQAAGVIEVILSDERHVQATLLGRAPDLDIALIEVDESGLQPARFMSATEETVGEPVVAVGAPGLLPRTVSAGRITAIRESMSIPGRPALTTVVETSACLRPGYSGGPTVDSRGRVVGISFAGTPGGGPGCRGFAIPSGTVLAVVDNLAAAAGEGLTVPILPSSAVLPSAAPVMTAP